MLNSSTWDLALSREKDLLLVDGAESVKQEAEILLKTFLGEWFLDITVGIPYLEVILVKNPDRAQIESILRAKLKEIDTIQSVPTVEIRVDRQNRTGQINLPDMVTDEGLVTASVIQ